jgi:hypothetical protein
MEKHALTSVALSPKDEAQLTETVKQYAERQNVVVAGRSEQLLVLPQIKYMFPAVPKKKVLRRRFVRFVLPRLNP